MELTKGMFGSEFNAASPRFGIRSGQMRCPELVHNGGWYNRAGEKLGWGDLSDADLRRIKEELTEGEMFIVLYEQDAFWNFVNWNPGTIGSMCRTDQTADAPGSDYIAEKAFLLITPDAIHFVDKYGYCIDPTMALGRDLTCVVITKEKAREMICG